MTTKQVKVTERFYTDVQCLLTDLRMMERQGEYAPDADMRATMGRLDSEIEKKNEAYLRNKAFAAYKQAPKGTAEREKYRKQYLTWAGAKHQTEKETPYGEPPEN